MYSPYIRRVLHFLVQNTAMMPGQSEVKGNTGNAKFYFCTFLLYVLYILIFLRNKKKTQSNNFITFPDIKYESFLIWNDNY